MKLLLFLSLCFILTNCYSQSNNIAFYIGPEISFPNDQYYYIDSANTTIGEPNSSKSAIGMVTDGAFNHLTKFHFGFQAGLSMKYLQFSSTYPIDSAPLTPPVNDLNVDPYRRLYDEKNQWLV